MRCDQSSRTSKLAPETSSLSTLPAILLAPCPKIDHRSFPLDQSRQECDGLMSVLGKPTTKCESRSLTADGSDSQPNEQQVRKNGCAYARNPEVSANYFRGDVGISEARRKSANEQDAGRRAHSSGGRHRRARPRSTACRGT